MKEKISFGAIESPKDERNWDLATATSLPVLDESIFLDADFLRARMQGKLGSCVANTLEEVFAYIIYKTTSVIYQVGTETELSWRFIYAICKSLEGTKGYEKYPKSPEGTYPQLMCLVVRDYGICLAKYCPNNTSLPLEEFIYNRNINNIPQEAKNDALERKIPINWFTVPLTEVGIKQGLKFAKENNGGVAILRRVGDTYWKDENGFSTWDKNKILPIKVPKIISSGHEEFLTGYDGDKIYWLNSWSSDWADNGRGWEYLSEWLKLINEVIVIVPTIKGENEFKYDFKKTIKYGEKSSEVVALQTKLKTLGFFTYPTITGYYGTVTAQAVLAFQIKNNVAPMSELTKLAGRRVGQKTINKLNMI